MSCGLTADETARTARGLEGLGAGPIAVRCRLSRRTAVGRKPPASARAAVNVAVRSRWPSPQPGTQNSACSTLTSWRSSRTLRAIACCCCSVFVSQLVLDLSGLFVELFSPRVCRDFPRLGLSYSASRIIRGLASRHGAHATSARLELIGSTGPYPWYWGVSLSWGLRAERLARMREAPITQYGRREAGSTASNP